MSDSLWPHGLQHAKLLCPPLSPEFTQIHLHWVGDGIQPSPLLPPSPLPSIFSSESTLHQVAKVLELQPQLYPSKEYSGLTSFRIDWFKLFPVQGTLKSLLQHHSSKASIIQHSAFFMVQLSHPYMATGKTNSFDYTDLCQPSGISAFQYAV